MSDDTGQDADPTDAASVLIVDDEMLIATFLEDTLDVLGFRSSGTAGSAEEAVTIARARRPDIALVDIGLRGKTNGIELARQLKDELGIAIVFLSGSTDPETRRSAEAIGPHGFLSKPCTEGQIEAMLRSVRLAPRTGPPSPGDASP